MQKQIVVNSIIPLHKKKEQNDSSMRKIFLLMKRTINVASHKNIITLKKGILQILALATCLACVCCTNRSTPNPEDRTYETSFNSETTSTSTEEDSPYMDNSLSTGDVPYTCSGAYGNQSSISIKTSSVSNCDVVVILKDGNGDLIRNAYICAGGSYTFKLPNGTFQVFFYGGRGWNPDKAMPNGELGGFIANESYSKDDPVTLDYEELEYSLIPQQNGNFRTRQSNASEIF